MRVGVPKELNEAEGISPGVAEAVRRAIDLCAELGPVLYYCSGVNFHSTPASLKLK